MFSCHNLSSYEKRKGFNILVVVGTPKKYLSKSLHIVLKIYYKRAPIEITIYLIFCQQSDLSQVVFVIEK